MKVVIKCGCCGFESTKITEIHPVDLKRFTIKTDHCDEDSFTEIPVSVREEEVGEVKGILYLLRCPKCGTVRIEW